MTPSPPPGGVLEVSQYGVFTPIRPVIRTILAGHPVAIVVGSRLVQVGPSASPPSSTDEAVAVRVISVDVGNKLVVRQVTCPLYVSSIVSFSGPAMESLGAARKQIALNINPLVK